MRTAKYHDYALVKIFAFVLLVILGVSIYLIFVKPSQEHRADADAWVTVEPTCHSDGYRYKICVECGEMFDKETLYATDHQSFKTEKENEKNHTLTEGGSYDKVVYCKDCGEEISREKVLLGGSTHNIRTFEEDIVEATCEEDGHYVLVTRCDSCDAEISRENKVVDALGHKYTWKVIYNAKDGSYSLHGVCDIDGTETSVTDKNSDNFEVIKDEAVASCCPIIYIVSCTYKGEYIEVEYDTTDHPHSNHTVEFYPDKDSIYDPQPIYIVLPDPEIDPVYGEYYNIDEISGIDPYYVGNSVWNEHGFSFGVFKCYACEEFECSGCSDDGYRFVVRIYSAKYDTRLNDTEN